MVRSPWTTSKPNSAGIPNRLPWIVSRCSRLISIGSVTKSSDPASPRRQRGLDQCGLAGYLQRVARVRGALLKSEIEVLGELAGLFREGHIGQQLINP